LAAVAGKVTRNASMSVTRVSFNLPCRRNIVCKYTNGDPGRFYGQSISGTYVKLFEFVESLDGLCDEIGVLACHCDSIGNPVDVCCDSAIACNVFSQVYAMCEQKHSAELEIRICVSSNVERNRLVSKHE
jgi:hypothetical protein